MLDGVGGAVAQMILKKPARNFPKGFVHGGDLDENVCAIAIFFNHSLKSADLPFDSPKTIEISGFDLGIDGHCMFTWPITRMLGFV
jgi:hypothetical protein